MEQRVRNFLQPTKEAEERIASIHVAPHNPGVSPSFYESFTVRGTRVESADHGVIRCSFRVAPGYTDSDGNLSSGAIANLVDEHGGAVLLTNGHHTKVSVNISIAYLSTAKLGNFYYYVDFKNPVEDALIPCGVRVLSNVCGDELEITARVLGHQGAYSGTAVTLRNKRTGEIVAEGRHSLFGKFYSNI